MKLFPLIPLLISITAFADDSAYEDIRDDVFWPEIYNGTYEGLYCGRNFLAPNRITVEHVFSASWIASHHGCPNRDSCPIDAYRDASSDLHNLWPAEGRYNSSRGNQKFGIIDGETPRFANQGDNCDFERTSGSGAIVEPREAARGKVARSLLYMHLQYGFPLTQEDMTLYIDWAVSFPPDQFEFDRHDQIQAIQGRENPFITLFR